MDAIVDNMALMHVYDTHFPHVNGPIFPDINENTLPNMDVLSLPGIVTDIEHGLSKDIPNANTLINPACAIPQLPDEMVEQIAWCLTDPEDIRNMRLVSKRFSDIAKDAFLAARLEAQVIYPRYECFRRFLSLLVSRPMLQKNVREITLVSEGLREHEYGYQWAWEHLTDCLDIQLPNDDVDIINAVNYMHHADIVTNGPFINGGGYRSVLTMLMRLVPNLDVIKVRGLRWGEHNPYWGGPEALKGLTFYREDLETTEIFYGDWKYDTVHYRVTASVDEWTGAPVLEPGAGPQAAFRHDLRAALAASSTRAKVLLVL